MAAGKKLSRQGKNEKEGEKIFKKWFKNGSREVQKSKIFLPEKEVMKC